MPVMDGLALLSRLGDLDLLLKSVIVSAYGDMENIRTAMNRGAFDFVTKPINLQDLETTIKKALNEMHTLKEALESRNQLMAIQQELDVARNIQQSIVPGTFLPFPNREEFEIFGSMNAAREVGGDFFDFFFIDDYRLGFVIGDVYGKGVPEALFMAVSRTLLKATALEGFPPGVCMNRVNGLLYSESVATMFVTIFYGILNTKNGELEYCNGGHNPPYIIRKDGNIEALDLTGGLVVGALPKF
jgi:sigma-B regulation protein RsbU (phosphoserine phosphatase)